MATSRACCGTCARTATQPLGEVAALAAGAGRLAGFDDLARAAAAVADGPDGPGTLDPVALFLFGYTCMEHGAGYLAIGPRIAGQLEQWRREQERPSSRAC